MVIVNVRVNIDIRKEVLSCHATGFPDRSNLIAMVSGKVRVE